MTKKRNLGEFEKVEQLKDVLIVNLDNDKADDIQVIDLRGKADFAYFMIIATGKSTRHTSALADKVIDYIKHNNHGNVNIEGRTEGEWVLIDANDIIIHLFIEETRKYYNLEKIWLRSSSDEPLKDQLI